MPVPCPKIRHPHWRIRAIPRTQAKHTGATLVWLATTTIKMSSQSQYWSRVTSDSKVRIMNKLAADIMKRHGIPAIDAYAISR